MGRTPLVLALLLIFELLVLFAAAAEPAPKPLQVRLRRSRSGVVESVQPIPEACAPELVDPSALPEPESVPAEPPPIVEEELPPPVEESPAPASPAPSRRRRRSSPPTPAPYKGVFYDNDFSYLEDDWADEWRLGDDWKRLRPHCDVLLDLGGEYRLRHHHEHGLRGSDLSGRNDDFLLQRTRLYADLNYAGFLRAYAEAIDATSAYENHPPRTIEENRFDALNLFGEMTLWDDEGRLAARAGRQELLYGAERLISPLDWANTRRTFDGAKLFWRGEDWDVDGFWTRPVPFDQHEGNDHEFDHWDESQEFMGLYAAYKGRCQETFDFYYLRYAEYQAPGTPAVPTDFDVHTFGARWKGEYGCWRAEAEGGYQFGQYGTDADPLGELDHSAGFATVGVGRLFPCLPAQPTVWGYYDWASGDRDPADGQHGTFNQLFPLGHKYFGWMDLVARQNIHDMNVLFTARPDQDVLLQLWWHVFYLDQSRDALYNSAGVPIRNDPTGAAGREVGQELDFLATFALTPRVDLGLGYSHFWAGRFVRRTNPAGVSGDADFYYSTLSVRF